MIAQGKRIDRREMVLNLRQGFYDKPSHVTVVDLEFSKDYKIFLINSCYDRIFIFSSCWSLVDSKLWFATIYPYIYNDDDLCGHV